MARVERVMRPSDSIAPMKPSGRSFSIKKLLIRLMSSARRERIVWKSRIAPFSASSRAIPSRIVWISVFIARISRYKNHVPAIDAMMRKNEIAIATMDFCFWMFFMRLASLPRYVNALRSSNGVYLFSPIRPGFKFPWMEKFMFDSRMTFESGEEIVSRYGEFLSAVANSRLSSLRSNKSGRSVGSTRTAFTTRRQQMKTAAVREIFAVFTSSIVFLSFWGRRFVVSISVGYVTIIQFLGARVRSLLQMPKVPFLVWGETTHQNALRCL